MIGNDTDFIVSEPPENSATGSNRSTKTEFYKEAITMSIFRQRDSLDWLPLFSVSEKEKKQTLQWIQQIQMNYDSRYFSHELLQITGLNSQNFRTDDTATQIACEYVALKFMIEDTNFAKDLLSAEDFEKAQSVFARKQLNSKILRHLLSCFFKMLRNST